MSTVASVLAGLLIAAGILGVIIPVLPGLVLCWLGVLVWAIFADGGGGRWAVLGAVTVIAGVGTIIKFAWPGRNLKRTGVPTRSIVFGGLLGIIGFFAIPVAGLPIGFVLGIWLAERVRVNDSAAAWQSTKSALRAVGLAILIELFAGFIIALVWVVGLFTA